MCDYIIQLLVVPLSILGAFFVNEVWLIRKRYTLNEKHRILQILLENRMVNETFIKTLNSAILLFGDDPKIKKSIIDFHGALKTTNKELRDGLLLDMLYEMCQSLGYKHVTKEDIDTFFQYSNNQ